MKTLLTHWYIWVLAYILGIIGLLASVFNDSGALLFFSLMLMFVGILMLVVLLIAAIIIPKAQLTHKINIILGITAGIIFFFVASFLAVIIVAVGQHHPPTHYIDDEPIPLDSVQYYTTTAEPDSVLLTDYE